MNPTCKKNLSYDCDDRSDSASNSDHINVSDDDSDKPECYLDIDVGLIQTSNEENHV